MGAVPVISVSPSSRVWTAWRAVKGGATHVRCVLSYGFRDDDYLFLKIRAAFPGNAG